MQLAPRGLTMPRELQEGSSLLLARTMGLLWEARQVWADCWHQELLRSLGGLPRLSSSVDRYRAREHTCTGVQGHAEASKAMAKACPRCQPPWGGFCLLSSLAWASSAAGAGATCEQSHMYWEPAAAERQRGCLAGEQRPPGQEAPHSPSHSSQLFSKRMQHGGDSGSHPECPGPASEALEPVAGGREKPGIMLASNRPSHERTPAT